MRSLYMIWLFHHKFLDVCVSTQCRKSLGLQCMMCCLVGFTFIVLLCKPQRKKHCIGCKELYRCQTCKWKFYCGTGWFSRHYVKAVNKTREEFWLEDWKDFENAGFHNKPAVLKPKTIKPTFSTGWGRQSWSVKTFNAPYPLRRMWGI